MNDPIIAKIQTRPFHDLLQNPRAVEFVNALIQDSFAAYFRGHEKEVSEMVGAAWALLVGTATRNPERLGHTVRRINREIFRKQDPDYWFNSIYKVYKTKIRPEKDFSGLKPYLLGWRVLDYGSGGGYLALLMSQNGYIVTTTDVIDYRVDEAKHLPFRPMTSPTDIPYPSDSFDTAILKAVLHHVDGLNLPVIVQELRRVSHRLIVEEDTYALPPDTLELQQLADAQPQLSKFIALSREDQLQALMLIDYFANAVAQGIVEMNFPFQFKSIPEWRAVFEGNGFRLTSVKLLGFQDGNVNKSCHVWLIFDRIE